MCNQVTKLEPLPSFPTLMLTSECPSHRPLFITVSGIGLVFRSTKALQLPSPWANEHPGGLSHTRAFSSSKFSSPMTFSSTQFHSRPHPRPHWGPCHGPLPESLIRTSHTSCLKQMPGLETRRRSERSILMFLQLCQHGLLLPPDSRALSFLHFPLLSILALIGH